MVAFEEHRLKLHYKCSDRIVIPMIFPDLSKEISLQNATNSIGPRKFYTPLFIYVECFQYSIYFKAHIRGEFTKHHISALVVFHSKQAIEDFQNRYYCCLGVNRIGWSEIAGTSWMSKGYYWLVCSSRFYCKLNAHLL